MTENTQQTEAEKVDELIDAVAPPVKKREQRIAGGPGSPFEGFDKTYTQQKLSFFGKLEFVRLSSRAISKAMTASDGEEAVNLTDLIGVQSAQDITSADVFIRAIARLAEFAPEIVKDIYMISLNVPAHEREIVAAILDEPFDDETQTGGLSDDDGFAIMETFVAQNARVMRDFFREKLPQIAEQVRKAVEPDPTPAPSKPSKRSARSTR